ncbi:MAG: class I SAM-dependent methyltransferase [Hyphomicrobiaceae bacterium]|nr:class I SAM-dependent methyltransferase [Hyphomicrobiaceae bacterium]
MQTAATSDASRMDRHYRYQRFIYDATRTHYLIGRKHLIKTLRPAPGQTVLEIGCGTAWNLAKVARRYPEALIHGVDVSKAMLDTARTSLRRKGLIDRVSLCQGDATGFDPLTTLGRTSFDRIFFSYALSMIPRWEAALAHAATMIAPGGELHIVDFGQCERLPEAFKGALFAFLRHYTVTPRADLEQRLSELAESHGLELAFQRLHRGYTDYAVLRRPSTAA